MKSIAKYLHSCGLLNVRIKSIDDSIERLKCHLEVRCSNMSQNQTNPRADPDLHTGTFILYIL